jgi:transcriptional regulator of nitric oxide reductase
VSKVKIALPQKIKEIDGNATMLVAVKFIHEMYTFLFIMTRIQFFLMSNFNMLIVMSVFFFFYDLNFEPNSFNILAETYWVSTIIYYIIVISLKESFLGISQT